MKSTMKPSSYPAGTCPHCIANYAKCPVHRPADKERERMRIENVRRAVESHRGHDLARACLRLELESDERGHRLEHAARYL